MTALCGGGTSQPQPGLGARLIVPAGLISAGLGLIDPLLLPFAVLLDAYVFDLVASCSTDPPPCPTFTDQDWADLVGDVLALQQSPALVKIKQLVDRYLWFQYCQCTTGSTPVFDCTPQQPPNTTVPPVGGVTPGCAGGTWHGTLPQYLSAGGGTYGDCTGLLPVGPGAPVQVRDSDNQLHNAYPIPAGVTGVEVSGTFTCAPSNAGNRGAQIGIEIIGGSGFLAAVTIFDCAASAPVSHLQATLQLPTGAQYWYARGLYLNPNQPYTPVPASATSSAFCGTSLPNTVTQPCVTDPAVLTMLQQIYKLLTIVQRQAAPFAYVHGATHSGLSGTGALTVQGLLGVKVLPSSIPPDAGVVLGDPDTLWLDSWINWGNADGWLAREFLRASPHVSLPNLAGQFTTIGYTLRPGLTVDIVELVREP